MIEPAHQDHLDSLDGFVELACLACGEDDAVPTTWYDSETSDAYLSACISCGALFELDWDEYGGDMLASSILHELRTDDETLSLRGGSATRT